MLPEVSLPQVISPAFAGCAVAHYHILCRTVHTQSVRVPSRFDTNIVVVAVYVTVLDQYVAGGVDVDAVRAWAVAADVIVDSQSVYGTIVGIENLTSPESCAHQVKPLSVMSELRSTRIPVHVCSHNPLSSVTLWLRILSSFPSIYPRRLFHGSPVYLLR